MQRALTPLMLVLLPIAAFLTLFHAGTLDVGNPGWLIRGSDNGENALGLHAYRYDPAAGASLHIATLDAPQGVPVLFLDANPLVTLGAKGASGLLPPDSQLIGWFVLLGFFLQVLFAWLLLRRHAPGPVSLWLGVVLLAFPPTLANRFVHTNLMAHWTILAALWLFLEPERGRKLRWWLPLIAVTTLIHSYLLVMVGAIWASRLLAIVWAGDRRARLLAVGQGVAVLITVGVIARWMGVGGQLSQGNFGRYSMPLDGLWNPGLPHFSAFLPGHEIYPGRGFEGFQYLGFGMIVLIAAALVIALVLRVPARPAAATVAARSQWLIPALLALGILATLSVPTTFWHWRILAALDPVRASGRLFWPIGYVLVLMVLLTTYRLKAQRAAFLLIAAVAIQAGDLAGMVRAVRAQTASADRKELYVRTRDPAWAGLIDRASSVAFMPSDVTRDLALFQEIAWRAVKQGKPVSNVYAARENPDSLARLTGQAKAFDNGALVPGRLYVLAPTKPAPANVADRVIVVDGVRLIPPQ